MSTGIGMELVAGRVSIVTPVYNGEKHLSRMLDSVLKQSYSDIEMILVDDGSTDRTLDVAYSYQERFRKRGISLRIIPAEHRNASAAINRGLPWVTGEFLIWPDSDDCLERDSVQKRVSFLQAYPAYQCVRSMGCFIREGTDWRIPWGGSWLETEEENLFYPVLLGSTYIVCGCYMLRTKPFFEIYPKRRIDEFDCGQNFQMLLPFLYRYPCPTIREELYIQYLRPDSHSHAELSEEQVRKQYGDFEELADRIVLLCGITDPQELNRIQQWKQLRRYRMYRHFNRRGRALCAAFQLYRLKETSFAIFLRRCVGIYGGPFLKRYFRRKYPDPKTEWVPTNWRGISQ